jgi:hypothetical protein
MQLGADHKWTMSLWSTPEQLRLLVDVMGDPQDWIAPPIGDCVVALGQAADSTVTPQHSLVDVGGQVAVALQTATFPSQSEQVVERCKQRLLIDQLKHDQMHDLVTSLKPKKGV